MTRRTRQFSWLAVTSMLVLLLGIPGPAQASFGQPGDLVPAGNNSSRAQIAVDSNGRATVVWTRGYGETTDKVQTRSIAADGALGTTQNLTGADVVASRPMVAVEPTGRATVVWKKVGANTLIQARTVAVNGTLGLVKTLSAIGADADDPQVGVDPDGRATVVWKRFNGTNFRVQARTIADDGTLGSVKQLSSTGEDADNPQVGVASDGQAIVAWTRFDGSNDRVQARTIAVDGTLGAAKTLSSAGEDVIDEPQLAVNSNGRATVVWSRYNGTRYRVQARTIAADGTLGSTQTLDAANHGGRHPKIGIDSFDRATVVWGGFGANDIQAVRIASDGTLGTIQTLASSGQPSLEETDLAVAPSGQATVAWVFGYYDDEPLHTPIRTRTIAFDGTLSETETLYAGSCATTYSSRCFTQNPQVASDSSGRATIVWGTLGNGPIQYARSEP